MKNVSSKFLYIFLVILVVGIAGFISVNYFLTREGKCRIANDGSEECEAGCVIAENGSAQCIEDYIGLTESEAFEKAETEGVSARLESRDISTPQEFLEGRTDDRNPSRFNFVVEDNKVIEVKLY